MTDMNGFQAPNVPLYAKASQDGSRVTVFFPDEFVSSTVALDVDRYGRHRILTNPQYNGRTVVGYVDNGGVKKGKVEFIPAEIGITKMTPGASRAWSAKQRENDLLIGTLLSDLADPACQPQPVVEKMFGEKFDTGEHDFSFTEIDTTPTKPEPIRRLSDLKVTAKPVEAKMTIEDALDFINAWAADNNGELGVENNTVYVEVRKRIGGRK